MPNRGNRAPSGSSKSGSDRRGPGRNVFGASQSVREPGSLEEIKRLGIILDRIVASGDAIMVSSTSDGGAIVVTVLSGDSRQKAYAAGQRELVEVWEQLELAYSPDSQPPD